jgi:hypothetical protein
LVKASDSKSDSLWERRFESCRLRNFLFVSVQPSQFCLNQLRAAAAAAAADTQRRSQSWGELRDGHSRGGGGGSQFFQHPPSNSYSRMNDGGGHYADHGRDRQNREHNQHQPPLRRWLRRRRWPGPLELSGLASCHSRISVSLFSLFF